MALVRTLEEVVIRALSSTFTFEAARFEGLTGVWFGNHKLAATGVKVSKWTTYHGLALNVTTYITPFQRIVPCGIRGHKVGSIKGLLKEKIMSKECGEEDNHHAVHITYISLVKEFPEVFQVDLH